MAKDRVVRCRKRQRDPLSSETKDNNGEEMLRVCVFAVVCDHVVYTSQDIDNCCFLVKTVVKAFPACLGFVSCSFLCD